MRPLAQRSGFLVKSVGDQVVLFDQSQQRLHVLSRTAAAVWRHCDGQHTVVELTDLVGRELGVTVDESLITLALSQLDEARLLEGGVTPMSGADSLSRRDLLHMAGALAAGIMMPMITSCGVPTEPRSVTPAAKPFLTVDNTTTTSTTATTPLFTTTTSTTGTTPLFTTTTSTTPLFTTTTSTTPLFTTTTSTTQTTTTSTTTTSTTSTTTSTTTPAPKKVAMCHEGRTIMVDQSAVAAHLAHGDTLGRCP